MTRSVRFRLGVLLVLSLALPAAAQDTAGSEDAIGSIDALIERVRQGWSEERAANREREERFRQRRQDQAQLLEEARAKLAATEARSERVELSFEQNEVAITELEETLKKRLGTLGELFGIVRQVAGDTRGHIEDSLISAQIPDREAFLEELGQSKALPSIDELERLWFELAREMAEQGKIVRFDATVLTPDGEKERSVVRAGVFAAFANGRYLRWEPAIGKLEQLPKQPPAQYVSTIDSYADSDEGLATLAIDPSRGQLLGQLVQTPSARERLDQGGLVGYITIALGVVAVLVGLVRFAILGVTNRRVSAQEKSATLSLSNPLGRVLQAYQSHRHADVETLELKLDEAVLHEVVRLERFHWLIKVVSVVAPLLGLLGTVTGMIRTFQAITLYGTGDPRMMAGGISEALVTTMIGLVIAIPLVLLHALLSSSSKRVVDVLAEQSAGLVATHAEESRVGA